MNSATKKPPRICFATLEYPPDWGGVGMSAQRIVKMLVSEGLDVHIFTPLLEPLQNGSLVNPESMDGATCYRVPVLNSPSNKSKELTNVVKNFYQAIDQVDKFTQFDLFHGFYLPMTYPCLTVAQKGNRPVIGSIRGDDGFMMLRQSPISDLVVRALQDATWITSVSTDSLIRANKVVDISQRSSFISNSIEERLFPKWQMTSINRGVVGTVCGFRRKKNLPLLVHSYSNISPALRRKLLLVGDFMDGMIRTNVFDIIDLYGVHSEVEITGYVQNSDVPKYLLAMHVFVLSSVHEGLPNAILEAAATGIPIVATAVDGIKDIFEHTENALLVSPEEPEELTAAIELVLKDEKLACKLSKEAQKLAGQYTLEKEKQEWLKVYQNLLC